jgi:hypothetical protein
MRKVIRYCLLTVLLYSSCKKNSELASGSYLTNADEDMILKAKVEFAKLKALSPGDSSYARQRLAKSVQWDLAKVQVFSFGKGVVAPIQYSRKGIIRSMINPHTGTDLNNISKLLIYQDQGGVFHSEVVSSFPDSLSVSGGRFSGFIKVESWNGNLLNEYQYFHDPKQETKKRLFTHDGPIAPAYFMMVICRSLDISVYSVDDPDNGVYSTEDFGCSSSFGGGGDEIGGGSASGSDYAGTSGYGGGGGGAGSGTSSVVNVPEGKHPIASLKTFLRCFTVAPKNTYSVMLCVDQPRAGERKSYSSMNDNGSSGFSVGHAFLAFMQNSGGLMTRTAMGFYPSKAVTPFNPTAQGSLNDDASHPYDVSLTISMTADQFFAVLDYFSNGNNTDYDLNNNNCATWALAALAKGGFSIKTMQGTWPFGGGDDPGDLGEDLRALPLVPGEARNLVGGTAPSNMMPCSTVILN